MARDRRKHSGVSNPERRSSRWQQPNWRNNANDKKSHGTGFSPSVHPRSAQYERAGKNRILINFLSVLMSSLRSGSLAAAASNSSLRRSMVTGLAGVGPSKRVNELTLGGKEERIACRRLSA